jgi:hypothetical protein
MRVRLSVAAVAIVLAAAPAAWAWSWPGHEVVGALASQMLTPNAQASVTPLLRGYSLAVAATWADCAKSVVRSKTGGIYYYAYQHGTFTPSACTAFETDAEKPLLEDFAKRNWTNCVYVGSNPCHEAWHFSDIAVERDGYDPKDVGANPHDIVHAINACVAVLRGGQAPAPFHIKDKSEALFLLAHYVGDLHQPLHVGAVYLSPNGALVDPDAAHPFDPKTATAGGNAILDGTKKLHADWDGISQSISTTGSADMLAAAKAVPATPSAASGWAGAKWAATWASDTVQQAHKAFANQTFAGDGAGQWTVDFSADPDARAHRADLQKIQLQRAGKRLADLLNAIWA